MRDRGRIVRNRKHSPVCFSFELDVANIKPFNRILCLKLTKGTPQGFASSGIVLHENGWVKTSMGDIAASAPRYENFCERLATCFEQGDISSTIGLGTGDRAKKTSRSPTNDDNFKSLKRQGNCTKNGRISILASPVAFIEDPSIAISNGVESALSLPSRFAVCEVDRVGVNVVRNRHFDNGFNWVTNLSRTIENSVSDSLWQPL